MSLTVRAISSLVELESIRGDWLALLALDASNSDLPFLLPEWLVPWWQTFRRNGPVVAHSLRVLAVRDEQSGRLVALAPFMLTERPGAGPRALRARTLALLGADPYITELRAPIVDPARQREAAQALARHLSFSGPGPSRDWDWVSWQGLDRESDFAKELERALPLQWGDSEVGNVLTLAATFEAFRSGLKRNIKESLRHCYNSLKRDGLAPRLVIAETAEDVARDLETFFSLHAKRARQTNTVVHPDRFQDPRSRQFLRSACEAMVRRGVVRVFTLHIGDTVVASRIGFVMPRCLYLYYSGFEPDWGRYSVATTLVAEIIKYAIGLGLPRVHLSMGADVSKARWGPATPVRHEATVIGPSLKSRAAYGVYTWARANGMGS